MRSSLPCARTSSGFDSIPDTPYVGIPALRVYIPSVAPACINGSTERPGQYLETSGSIRESSVGVGADGGLGIGGSSTVTATLSPASRRTTVSTSATGSPGRMRQFTTARATCGNALFAWPALTFVATHVVRSCALYSGERDSRAAAAGSGGTF